MIGVVAAITTSIHISMLMTKRADSNIVMITHVICVTWNMSA